MDFYQAQGMMDSLLTGDMAKETLELAEDEWANLSGNDQDRIVACSHRGRTNTKKIAKDVPAGEDVKWICGNCMATDWTPNEKRCKCCKD